MVILDSSSLKCRKKRYEIKSQRFRRVQFQGTMPMKEKAIKVVQSERKQLGQRQLVGQKKKEG
ncbi:hypothetical protein HanPI659440_Chr11g0422411 [Helianthus annuus]|nr:hypothetical protein HanPI659440_Chr11g0422411 [Helianthus annuus]